MLNPSGTQEVPLTLFGGVNLELQPTDLPQGLSPDARDIAFIPGSCFTRPELQRFSTLGSTAQIVYNASFLKPNGQVVQIAFDSMGGMFADGVQFGQTAAGNRFKVTSVFGRAFIAISDGLHGADVPLQFDGTNLDRVSQDGPGAPPVAVNSSLPAVNLTGTLVRSENVVTANTSTPHGMIVGNTAMIGGIADASRNLTSIVVNNETSPGIATVTMPTAHGFLPGNTVALVGVNPSIPGGGFQSYAVNGGVAQVTTHSAHDLVVGDTVLVSIGAAGILVSETVETVPSPTTFTFPVTTGNDSGTIGVIFTPWLPISGTQFEIQSTPSLTTFTVAVTQGNGTWTTGTVTYPWDGTFYVASVPTPTSFTYSQSGPDDTSGTGGTVTPVGQIAPGAHKFVVIFQTRTGYTTIPSPSGTITASGSQYLSLSDIPTGPPNVISRIIAFTSADGGRFFYIPVTPQLNGQIIGTSTVLNDNTTTSAVFDFSDEALLAATAIDIPGNNLFNQVVLGPCLSFFVYASRLFPWGERNKIQQFLNMGFEGGVVTPNMPLGWKVVNPGALVSGDYGLGWQISTGNGMITQPAFQDQYGVAILTPNTQYTLRLWASGNGNASADFYSPTAGLIASASAAAGNGYVEAVFSSKTPLVIPADTVLRVYGSPDVILDEIEIIYTDQPYLKTARGSYVNNLEAFDGVTGVIGIQTDPQPIMAFAERRDVLNILTYGPKGALYETEDTASGEPASWNLRHIASECGTISTWGVAKFEDWFCWTSDTGLRIYDGGTVDKMSQEVQPFWDSFNPVAKQFTVLANDPDIRRIYLLCATGAQTVTGTTWVLDYRELNTASALANSGTLRVGYSGKVITTDLTRKWCPWSMTMNYCGVVLLASGGAVMTFCGGTGTSLADPSFSSVYTLNEGSLAGVDADYGRFWDKCSYPTYFFIAQDDAEQRQLGVHRLHHGFATLNIEGIGAAFMKAAVDRIDNFVRMRGLNNINSRPLTLSQDLARDLEIGLDISGERVSYRICVQSADPSDPESQAGFKLSSLTISLKTEPFSPIRGWNG